MRRLLLTLLLVFLPFQAIWAAASPYCGHEAVPQATHFGHHDHDHQEGATLGKIERFSVGESIDAKALATTATADMDCHSCHGAGSGMALSANVQPIVAAVDRAAQQALPVWVLPPLSRPERPNWLALA